MVYFVKNLKFFSHDDKPIKILNKEVKSYFFQKDHSDFPEFGDAL